MAYTHVYSSFPAYRFSVLLLLFFSFSLDPPHHDFTWSLDVGQNELSNRGQNSELFTLPVCLYRSILCVPGPPCSLSSVKIRHNFVNEPRTVDDNNRCALFRADPLNDGERE